MTADEKIQILSQAAKYDVSCSSSGSKRENTPGGVGNAAFSGICHSWADDGRCISLLKILYTNVCVYDCAYCVNRRSNDIPRAAFTPEEAADLTINFYRRNYIEGLFLSSAVYKTPDYTMELLVRTVKLLRVEKKFNGYIHLKVIPGASAELINQAGRYADRLSANIELPSAQSLVRLAPDKKREDLIGTMRQITQGILQQRDESHVLVRSKPFAPAGQSTQLIIGATPESDRTIITLAEALYKKTAMKRVYYSAYMPVSNDSRLPVLAAPPLLREHRIYQADWLLRFYGFSASELFSDEYPDLDLACDPKVSWAVRNPAFFPVEINRADYEAILRVPGIGVRSALRIIKARRHTALTFDNLKKLGIVLKRSRYFITCSGKRYDNAIDAIRFGEDLFNERSAIPQKERSAGQLSLFPPPQLRLPDSSSIHGEM